MPLSTQAPDSRRRSRSRWTLALALALVTAIAVFYALGLQEYLSWTAVRASLADWQAEVQREPVSWRSPSTSSFA